MPAKEDKTEGQPVLSLKAREALLYSKIYRVFTIAALLFGFIVSGIVYDKLSDGSFMIFFQKPIYALYIFLPFIPTTILALATTRKVKKFHKFAAEDGIDIKSLRKRTDLYSHKQVKTQ